MPSIPPSQRAFSQEPVLCAPQPTTNTALQGVVDLAKCSDVSLRVQDFVHEQAMPAKCFAAQIVPPSQSSWNVPGPLTIAKYIPPGSLLQFQVEFSLTDQQGGQAEFYAINNGQAPVYHPGVINPSGWGNTILISNLGFYVFVLLTQGESVTPNWSFTITGPPDKSSIPPTWPLLVNCARVPPSDPSTGSGLEATVWYFNNTPPPNVP
jgi:hypothetical protein